MMCDLEAVHTACILLRSLRTNERIPLIFSIRYDGPYATLHCNETYGWTEYCVKRIRESLASTNLECSDIGTSYAEMSYCKSKGVDEVIWECVDKVKECRDDVNADPVLQLLRAKLFEAKVGLEHYLDDEDEVADLSFRMLALRS